MKQRIHATVAAILLLAASAHADVFRLLEDPRHAAQARIDLIEQAKSRIDIVYFLAHNDRITLCTLALLRDARRRGVERVRLLVDANFQHIPRAVLAHLNDEGVEVSVYHPLSLKHPSWLFRRMHEKLVIVDGARYITGGRNLAESYFGMAKRNFIDRDVYVEGPSAAQAEEHFEELWSSRDVQPLRVIVSRRSKLEAMRKLDEAPLELAAGNFVHFATGCDWSAGERDIGRAALIYDPVVKGGGPRVAIRLGQVIDRAKKSIVIESPYLIPSRSGLELLEKKRKEGVAVRIVTNSQRAIDGALPWAGYLRYRRRLLRAGVDIREFKGPDTLHAKTLIVDGRIVLVGSYNFDQRSQNLNAEVMCMAEDEELASGVLAAIDEHVKNSLEVGAPGRKPHVKRLWRFRAWLSRVLLPWIEPQL